MKRWLSTIIVIVLILAGLSLMLYPTVSDYIYSLSYRRVIADYRETVEKLDDESYKVFLEAAADYNKRLAKKADRSKRSQRKS